MSASASSLYRTRRWYSPPMALWLR